MYGLTKRHQLVEINLRVVGFRVLRHEVFTISLIVSGKQDPDTRLGKKTKFCIWVPELLMKRKNSPTFDIGVNLCEECMIFISHPSRFNELTEITHFWLWVNFLWHGRNLCIGSLKLMWIDTWWPVTHSG